MATPVILSINKEHGIYGDTIILTGTDLSNSIVMVGDSEVYASTGSYDEITFIIPINKEIGTYDIYVIDSITGTSNTIQLTIGLSPIILYVDPSRLVQGNLITINGDFLINATVKFNSSPIATITNTNNIITFNAPTISNGEYIIEVTNDFGVITTIVEIGEAPIINSVDKPIVSYNEVTTFNISNFIASSIIYIDGNKLNVVYRDANNITTVMPAIDPGTYQVTAENGFGTSTSFNINITEGAPYIQIIEPKKGSVDSIVNIHGFDLINSDVYFNSVLQVPLSITNKDISISIPNLSTGTYTIDLNNGIDVTSGVFEIIDTPEIENMTPRIIVNNNELLITGYNLKSEGIVKLLIGNYIINSNEFNEFSDTTILVTIPISIPSGCYRVYISHDDVKSNGEILIITSDINNVNKKNNSGLPCNTQASIYLDDASDVYTKPGMYIGYQYVIKVIDYDIDISTGGLLEIDGFQLQEDDVVQLINQSNVSNDGIYEVKLNTWELLHSSDGLYIDSGVRANDPIDGDLTRCLVVDNDGLDFSTTGVYDICYSVINSSDVITSICRKVKIMSPSSSIIPTHPLRISHYEITSEFNTTIINDLVNINENRKRSY
jgi:hypothetical protein